MMIFYIWMILQICFGNFSSIFFWLQSLFNDFGIPVDLCHRFLLHTPLSTLSVCLWSFYISLPKLSYHIVRFLGLNYDKSFVVVVVVVVFCFIDYLTFFLCWFIFYGQTFLFGTNWPITVCVCDLWQLKMPIFFLFLMTKKKNCVQ